MQKTLSQKLSISGVGLHSGCKSTMVINPAPENTQIRFVRSDLASKDEIKALFSNVADTRNCTVICNQNRQIVSTIEHIMATLYAFGVDNAIIEVDNPEIPIMDGSAGVFCKELQKIKLKEQNAKRKILKVLKTVRFDDGKGGFVQLEPSDELEIAFAIDFPSKIVGHQEYRGKITKEVFVNNIAPARTFCEKYQVDYLKSIGLIKGGNLENAVVLDGEKILNPEGFRIKDECVVHKVLDCIGDMYTSGYRMQAKITAFHSGHFHNNEVLKVLFSDLNNYEITEE